MTAAGARDDYAGFAETLQGTGILSDPWLSGRRRFRSKPVVLTAAALQEMEEAAEAVALAHHHVALAAAREPALLDTFFGLSPWQKLMALAAGPHWHGIARADVFLTADGPKVCELNSDTPSGEAEAVLLGRLAAAERPDLADPNAGLEDRFCRMVEAVARRWTGAEGALSAGIVYPTEITEDLSMIALYRGWFESRGWHVTLGSPFNLGPAPDGGVALLGERCDVLIRHYKTDWWSEREPAWSDAAPPPDAGPIDGPLALVLRAAAEGRVAVVNPFGAVVTQDKRALALLHERPDLFPDDVNEAVRRWIPRTARLETLPAGEVLAERDRWVLKSDFGCEGEEVVIGAACAPEEWRLALEAAVPGRWVAQERFEPLLDADGAAVNHGVYVVAGEAAGIYARIEAGATDVHAVSAPVLVEDARP